MIRRIIISLIIIGVSPAAFAQETDDFYYLNTYAGAGYGFFLTDLETEGLSSNGFNGYLRIMWQPEHLLRIGIETGFIQFYSMSQSNVNTIAGDTDITAKLTGIPIIFVYSMEIIESLEISAGAGTYLLYSTADSHGNKVTSSEISIGHMVSLTNLKEIQSNIKIGGEVKWNYVNKIRDGNLSTQLVLKYQLTKW